MGDGAGKPVGLSLATRIKDLPPVPSVRAWEASRPTPLGYCVFETAVRLDRFLDEFLLFQQRHQLILEEFKEPILIRSDLVEVDMIVSIFL